MSQVMLREQRGKNKRAASGAAGAKAAGKKRAVELKNGLEQKARLFDDEDIARELEAAKAAGSHGFQSKLRALDAMPSGFTVVARHGADACRAMEQYIAVLQGAAHVASGDTADVTTLDTDDVMVAAAADLSKAERQAANDAVCHVEHFTSVQHHEVDAVRGESGAHAVVLQEAPGRSVGVLLYSVHDDRRDAVVRLVHVRLAWRRQQLAEALWMACKSMLARGQCVTIVAPCCQAGTAGRFWTRMGFAPSEDAAKLAVKIARGKQKQAIPPGHYQWSYTVPQ